MGVTPETITHGAPFRDRTKLVRRSVKPASTTNKILKLIWIATILLARVLTLQSGLAQALRTQSLTQLSRRKPNHELPHDQLETSSPWQHTSGARWTRCQVPKTGHIGFTRLDPAEIGFTFTNRLDRSESELNRLLEDGSGVAAGDVDGDGKCDLYFCRLDGPNVLYRNLGDWRFTDITDAAGVACPGQFSTGALLADLDGDGDLDLLVTSLGGGTRCFLNDGHGHFHEHPDCGLRRTFGATSMALADIDGDGDLDLYVANYRTTTWKDFPPGLHPKVVWQDGTPVALPKDRFVAELDPHGRPNLIEVGEPDILYLNDGHANFHPLAWTDGHFLDEDGHALKEPPRHWGLSVAFHDLNGDGRPDIYVCNDFRYGGDDVWINLGGDRFRRIPRLALRHSSWSSMAIDFADINRDGQDDFLVVDMLSRTHKRRLTQSANIETGLFPSPIGAIDNRPQYQQNTLFLNRGDGTYAEIAQLARLDASEWSWNLAFLDVDLDGYEDLLVATGNAHDLLDGDATIRAMRAQAAAPRGPPRTLSFYPPLPLPNLAFRNRRDLTFAEVGRAWGFADTGISQGMCLADLDNDGDLDVVLNNLRDAPGIYRNDANAPRLAIRLLGRPPNTQGIGATIRVTPVNDPGFPTQSQVITAGGRYLSSDEALRVFAAHRTSENLTVEVRWPDGDKTVVSNARANRLYEIEQPREKRAPFLTNTSSTAAARRLRGANTPRQPAGPFFENVSHLLRHRDRQKPFDDLARQPLLPWLPSRLGPGVAWHDLNGDGWEDLLIANGSKGAWNVFLNQKGHGFRRLNAGWTPAQQTTVLGWTRRPRTSEILSGLSNVTGGGRIQPSVLLSRVDGSKVSLADTLPGQQASVGPLVLADFDGDGDLDLFVGGRLNPGRYPEPAISRLYRNEHGRFRLNLAASKKWADVGLVSGAVAGDLDGDGDPDLILACEWGPLRVYRNDHGTFTEVTRKLGFDRWVGWWNGVTTGDFDEDGRLDILATNWGRNTKYEKFRAHPLRLYYGDFDHNGTLDLIESYFDDDLKAWVPERDLITMGYALPFLQQRYDHYATYATQSVAQVLSLPRKRLRWLEANWLETTLFLNRGDHFEAHPLPIQAQFAPAFGVNVADFDGDGHEDVFLSQNFFATAPNTPRYDAGRGLWLRGDGKGHFQAVPGQKSGILIYGEQRGSATADFDHDGRPDLVVTQNGAETILLHNVKAKPGLRVRLRGLASNPDAVGAQLRLNFATHAGPLREIHSGSGYWSQDSPVQVLSLPEPPKSLWIRWPGGQETTVILPPHADLAGQTIVVRQHSSARRILR